MFVFVGLCPPANIPRVAFDSAVKLYCDVVLSPKSSAFPVELIVTYSIILEAEGKSPAHNPLVEELQAPVNKVVLDKSPKSIAFPVDDMFIYSITL